MASKSTPSCQVLERVYGGEQAVVGLIELLQRYATTPHGVKLVTKQQLLDAFTDQEHRIALEGCLAVDDNHPSSQNLVVHKSLEKRCTQEQIVNRAVERLVRQLGEDVRHLLTMGYRVHRTSSGLPVAPGFHHVECYFPNSSVHVLKNAWWQALHDVVGDVVMLRLLLHASVFWPLENGCYLQLTGRHLYQAWQQRSDAQQRIAIETMLPELTAQGAAAFAATSAYLAQRATTCTQGWGGAQMTMGSGGGGGTQAQAGGAFVTQAPWGTHTIATQAPWGGHTISTQAPVYTAATHDDGISGGGGSGGGGGKRKRHPRWLRRRQAKRQAKAAAVVAAAAAAHEDEEEEEMEDDNESKGMVLHREQYDGQHDGQQTKRKRVHASTTTTRTAHTSVFRVPPPPQHPQAAAPPRRAQQHNRPPMPHQPPNKDRPPTAPAPRGSTAATIHSIRQPNPLAALQGSPHRAALLYTSIFNPQYNALFNPKQGPGGTSQGSGYRKVPRVAEEVPPCQQHILPLLDRMIVMTAKCPFKRLLDLYCPCKMPPGTTDTTTTQPPTNPTHTTAPPHLSTHPPTPSTVGPSSMEPSSLSTLPLSQPITTPSTQPAGSTQQTTTPSTVPAGEPGGGPCTQAALGGQYAPVGGSSGGVGGSGGALGTSGSGRQRRLHQMRLQQYTPGEAVGAFVWACIRHCVPRALLGDRATQRQLRKHILSFVQLRRYEHMTLHQACPGVRSTPRQHALFCQQQLHLWVGWLFTVLVVPMLRTCFYITESEHYRTHIFYYRKPVWHALQEAAMSKVVGQQYVPVHSWMALKILQGRELGAARLRLLPKNAGMRPISNQSSRCVARFKVPEGEEDGGPQGWRILTVDKKPINVTMQLVGQALKAEILQHHPHRLGCSVLGYNDTYKRLHPYLHHWHTQRMRATQHASHNTQHASHNTHNVSHNTHHVSHNTQHVSHNTHHVSSSQPSPALKVGASGRTTHAQRAQHGGRLPVVYIVAVDVRRAFDSIQVPRLLKLLGIVQEDMVQEDMQHHVEIGAQDQQHHVEGGGQQRKQQQQQGNTSGHNPHNPAPPTPLLRQPGYMVVKYTQAVPHFTAVKCISRSRALHLHDPFVGFPSLAAARSTDSRVSVFADQVLYTRGNTPQLVQLLMDHLQHALLLVDGVWYQQNMGIPQGSTLSTLLCNLYLADMEATHLHSCLHLPSPHTTQCHTQQQAHAGQLPAPSTASSHGHLTELAKHAAGTNSTSGVAHGPPLGERTNRPSQEANSAAHGGSENTTPTATRTAPPPSLPWMIEPAAASTVAAAAPAATTSHGVPPTTSHGVPPPTTHGVPPTTSHGVPPTTSHGVPNTASHGVRTVLVRQVDDALLLTDSRRVAMEYVERMMQAFPDYGIRINVEKTKTSFPCPILGAGGDGTGDAHNVYVAPDGARFVPWCGLLVNVTTLEIQADYTRYSGERLISTMTLPHTRAELNLVPKLCQFLQPKCHPLLLDTSINSADVVGLNIYQMHLLAAMKLHCYVTNVKGPPIRNAVLSAAIERGMSYCRYLIRSRIATARERWGIPCGFTVPQQHVKYLAVHAFVRVLRRKHQRYAAVLTRLEAQLQDFPVRVARALAGVVDGQRSAVLLQEVVF